MDNKLLVIYYHEVVEDGKGYHYQKIGITKFEKQMKYLFDNKYRTLLFSEISESLQEKTVIVSFDDGFQSVYYNAFPIMKKYGIKGNIYLPTYYIGNDERFVNWEMIQEMVDSGLFEMAAHTHNHVDIRTLSLISLEEQIHVSDDCFINNIGIKPKAFCIPYGTYNHKSIRNLRRLNRYQYILGSYYGRSCVSRIHKKVLPRIGISDRDTFSVFVEKINGSYDWKGYLQRIRLAYWNIKKQFITDYDY